MGVSSAYAFGLQIAEFLSDIPGYVPLPDAQAFLAELEEQYNAVTTALSQAAPEGLAHSIEHGRKMGFSLLMHEARKFLLPLHLQDTEENACSNHQREQGEKLQPTCKWVPLKVHDNTVDIAIQRLQATVAQCQHYLRALDELLAMTQHREFGSREATAYLHNFVQGQVGFTSRFYKHQKGYE